MSVGLGIGISPLLTRKPSTSYFLQKYPGASVAYSFRQLSPTATYCVSVRRSNDNVVLDIPFLNGYCNTALILSHCGANSGYITKSWDQSGNNNHRIQATAGNQPRIVNAGVLEMVLGDPAIYYDGVDDYFTLTTPLSAVQPWSSFHKIKKFTPGSFGTCLSSSVVDAPFTLMDYTDRFLYARSSAKTVISTSAQPNTSARRIQSSIFNSSGTMLNGHATVVNGFSGGTAGVGNFIDYGRRETQYGKGWEQEFIFYASDKTSTALAIQANIVGGVSSLPSSSTNGYLIGVAGQSNATDRFTISGNISAALQAIQSDSWTHLKTVDDSSDNGFWCKMKAGINTTTEEGIEGMFAIHLPLASKLKGIYGKAGYIVPTAIGGTGLDNAVVPGWNSTHVGEYYDRLVTNFLQAKTQALLVGTLTPVLIWNQGEFDAGVLAYANNYETNLTALITKFRIDTGLPNCKVIITQLRSDTSYTYRATIRTAQANVAANMTNVYLFDTSPYPISSDLQHYNPIVASYGGTQSATLMGEGLADLIATF